MCDMLEFEDFYFEPERRRAEAAPEFDKWLAEKLAPPSPAPEPEPAKETTPA